MKIIDNTTAKCNPEIPFIIKSNLDYYIVYKDEDECYRLLDLCTGVDIGKSYRYLSDIWECDNDAIVVDSEIILKNKI